jgi:hypothetical protein
MVEKLAIFVGMCVILYSCFWLFETVTGRSKKLQEDRSALDSIGADLADAVANAPLGNIGEYQAPIIACQVEAILCPETAEAVGALGEGLQGVLEVAGEGLGNIIGGL